MAKVIARIRGGLGNQLFCYAAARRLALANDAELVLDDVSGFVRDRKYRRSYMLDHFSIPVRKATAMERLEPLERYRRGLKKFLSRNVPFGERQYVQQEGIDFDPRLLELKPQGCVYLDGLWQSEGYFADVAQTIRKDLSIVPPTDDRNLKCAESIEACTSVALHVRWFDPPGGTSAHNIAANYYDKAIAQMEARVDSPHYFLFSDNPEAAHLKLDLPSGRVTFVSHNHGDENAYADMWLMTRCRHFITANSTFSWWGAWLGESEESVILVPNFDPGGNGPSWGFEGLIPDRWELVPAEC